MKKIKLFYISILLLVLMFGLVYSFTPQSDINMRNYYSMFDAVNITADNFFGTFIISEDINLFGYNIYNATNVNATNVYQDGNIVLDSSDESSLNVNSSNYWDSLNTPLDITGLNDSNIVDLSWTKLKNYPIECPTNTYVTQIEDTVTCTAITQIDNDLNMSGNNLINVNSLNKIYYVKNNNGTDIQIKINNANSDGGGIVYIPTGTYNINSTIILYNNVKIMGAGIDQTIINVTKQIAILLGDLHVQTEVFLTTPHNVSLPTQNISISDISIKSNMLASGITFRRSGYGELRNIKIYDNVERAIYLSGSQTRNNYLNNIHVYGSNESAIYLDTAFRNTLDSIFISNVLYNDGLLVRQSDLNIFSNFYIKNVGILDGITYGNGIRLIDGSEQNTFNSFIIENTPLNGININSNNNQFNNFIMENLTTGIYLNEAHNNSISLFNINNILNPIYIGGSSFNTISNININEIMANSARVIYIFIDTPVNPDNNIITGISAICINSTTESIEINGDNNLLSNSIFNNCADLDDNGNNNLVFNNIGIKNILHNLGVGISPQAGYTFQVIGNSTASAGYFITEGSTVKTTLSRPLSSGLSNWFYRNQASTVTGGALVFVEQDHASDDQNALNVQQDGSGIGISLDINGDAVGLSLDTAATSQRGLYVYRNVVSSADGLTTIFSDNLGDTGTTLFVRNDGSGNAVKFDQNGANTAIKIEGGSCAVGQYGMYESVGDLYWCKDGVATILN